jgi:hypothetical protein
LRTDGRLLPPRRERGDVVPDSTFDYCPFCGARLGEGHDAVDDHPAEYDDCAERFEVWRGPSGPVGGNAVSGGYAASGVRLLTWPLMILVLAYSLLITQTILLGIIAATLVYIASFLLRRTVLAG